MFQIIFLFPFLFLRQNYLQNMKLSINTKESLMMKRLKVFFKISINTTGIPLKLIRIQMKLTTISFCSIYDTIFPINKIKIKTKDLESLCINKGIKKSSKMKYRFYSEFKKIYMKNRKKNFKITKIF